MKQIQGANLRGIEILRCGARTPTVRLRGHGIEQILRPRRRTVGASPHSVELQFHAPTSHAPTSHALAAYAFLTLYALLTLTALALPTTAHAAPRETTKEAAAKDTVQVQTALSGSGSSSKETNLGDLVADAVRQTGSAQAALIPADEIDGSALIPAGKTEAGKIIAALHYADDPGDTVVVLNLTGAQLLKVAERSVSRVPEPFEGFLQVSGLQIRYTASQPEGKRVSLVGIGGSEIDAAKSYKVATTRSLAGGGLGYYQIWASKDITDDTGTTLAKSLGSYLSAHPVISSAVENRISKN